ncbi:Vitellin-degrading protease [Frankliniella fusca]|uniref:Vitellin-degrading protease n=1 Tax=Frankliniella fusca TaxID=407009 RepID=A0AAE1LJ12_9NEOP|nr:Vitellin-degrading protease [Frankliniella fusca]
MFPSAPAPAPAPALALLALLALPGGGLAGPAPGQLNANVGNLPVLKKMQIVGGMAADIKEFGHQVSWLRAGRHMCGGSIISPEYIISAAHCCVELNLTISEIVAGSTIIPNRGRGQVVQIAEVHAHPDFEPLSYSNDIAVLKVAPPFKFDETVRPIAVMDTNITLHTGDPVYVTGWGKLSEFSSTAASILQKVKVQMKDFETCKQRYGEIPMVLTDTTFCAAADGKDACQGDSGGPLIYKTPEKDYLLGIVSSGKGCAVKEFPGLYTDLRNEKMRNFVTKVTGMKL